MFFRYKINRCYLTLLSLMSHVFTFFKCALNAFGISSEDRFLFMYFALFFTSLK